MKPTRAAVGLWSAAAIAVIAWVVPHTTQLDSQWYIAAAARPINRGCPEIHCFRVLVPWILSPLPGVDVKWRVYSAVFNALAALAVFDLSLAFGMSRRAGAIAAALSAFGSQCLWRLYDPFNSDPLMFFLSPLLTRWLLEDRVTRAFVVTSIGVFAKEFVVVPLALFTLASAFVRRWSDVVRTGALAAAAFTIWLALHVVLMSRFGYNYGGNPSTKLLQGGYLWFWLTHEPLAVSIAAQFVEFGAVYLLLPIGFLKAPRRLKALTLAALPIAAVFCYVEQPDRALWNFHFLMNPLAALALEPLPNAIMVPFVALYAAANLRIGAQLTFAPPARYALAGSVLLGLGVIAANHCSSRAGATPALP